MHFQLVKPRPHQSDWPQTLIAASSTDTNPVSKLEPYLDVKFPENHQNLYFCKFSKRRLSHHSWPGVNEEGNAYS